MHVGVPSVSVRAVTDSPMVTCGLSYTIRGLEYAYLDKLGDVLEQLRHGVVLSK